MFKNEDKENINVQSNVDLHGEAKNLVLEEMEKMGMINKMRAQIKSSVLNILEKQKQSVRQNVEFDYITSLNKMNKTKEVLLAFHLIKEFLQFYEMEYTIPIFENESNIRENLKKDTLINELQLQNVNLNSTFTEPKPVLIQLISAYQQEMVKKVNTDNLSQKLDDGYGGKGHNYPTTEIYSAKENKSDSNSLPGKKQLTPLNFANKSIDMKEPDSPQNQISNEKFNTANINDVYNNNSNSPSNINSHYHPDIKANLNTEENKKIILDKKNEDTSKYEFSSNDYNTNDKYDDEFNEVILEEIIEGKNNLVKLIEDENEIEDSKISVTANSNNNILSSMGYDNSISNYKLDEFDHVEDIEKP